MKSNISRLQKIFFAVFLGATLSVFCFHYFYVWPRDRCVARGPEYAWAGKWMKCAKLYSIETITHRPLNVPPINTDPSKMEGPRAEHSAKK
ncbi:hypothetical protein [Caulobacter sp. CCG-8]|uniref:hypothetical protein n=1 Tax=Caulobacter sp. CCG-8 TaxID=3127958 RepID=UPI00307D34DF